FTLLLFVSFPIGSIAFIHFSGSPLLILTVASSFAYSRAIAFPIPAEAPVTSTVFPFKCKSILSFLLLVIYSTYSLFINFYSFVHNTFILTLFFFVTYMQIRAAIISNKTFCYFLCYYEYSPFCSIFRYIRHESSVVHADGTKNRSEE